ncbi:MAG: lipoyl(octanoyl) transferase LipB [Deltaproteobacteria bacterium]|nr:lipoyl(octanoyl) transferase LipB [Deltaproteobacteria bacterium]
MSGSLEVRDLGLVEYEDGLRAQDVLAAAVRAGEIPDQLLLLRHPPVVTLGRLGRRDALRVDAGELARRGIELFHVDRGGEATYHDQGQLVGYPILRLAGLAASPAGRRAGATELVWLVEELLRRTLAALGVEAGRLAGLPGLWHRGSKIAALGMRIDRGVSRHGFALNLATEPSAWQVVVPCGLAGRRVVSLAEVLGRSVAAEQVVALLVETAGQLLGRRVQLAAPEQESVQALVVREEEPQLLVLRRLAERGGFWQPVTGMIEPGEPPVAAARREVKEETGLEAVEIADLGYVHAFLVEPGLRTEPDPLLPSFLREHSFIAWVLAGQTVKLEPREHDAAEWVIASEAERRMRWRGNRRAISLFFQKKAGMTTAP